MNYTNEEFMKWVGNSDMDGIREKFCVEVLFKFDKDSFDGLDYRTIHFILRNEEMSGKIYSRLLKINDFYKSIPKFIKLYIFTLACYIKYYSDIEEISLYDFDILYDLLMMKFSRIKSKKIEDFRTYTEIFLGIDLVTVGAN